MSFSRNRDGKWLFHLPSGLPSFKLKHRYEAFWEDRRVDALKLRPNNWVASSRHFDLPSLDRLHSARLERNKLADCSQKFRGINYMQTFFRSAASLFFLVWVLM